MSETQDAITSLLDPADLRVLVHGAGTVEARGAPFFAEFVRELGTSDILRLQSERLPAVQANPIQRLRTKHHTVARLLAVGEPDNRVAIMADISVSRIAVLKQDPAFQELMAFYKAQADAVVLDAHQRMATLGVTAIEVLQERLEETPDDVSTKEVISIAEMAAERAGIGAASGHIAASASKTPLNINITFEAGKTPAAQGGAPVISPKAAVIIDVKPEPIG